MNNIQTIIDLLNDAYKCDPDAMQNLVKSRVNCNATLANHSTIQVGVTKENSYTVGLLGILNGIVGTQKDGKTGWICAVYDDDYEMLLGFEVLEEDKK